MRALCTVVIPMRDIQVVERMSSSQSTHSYAQALLITTKSKVVYTLQSSLHSLL